MVSYGFKQPTLNRVTKKNLLLVLPRMIPILRKKSKLWEQPLKYVSSNSCS